jgi:3-oxoacyl-[acyl-carrier-protein] synthase-3
MLAVQIAGLGYYLPKTRVLSSNLEEQLALPRGWIEARTGVRERRYAGHGETAVSMAAHASRMALADAGLEPDSIDAIIGASAAPQQGVPCTAALLQRELGARDGGSACFDVNATCLSFLFGLQTAAHLVAAGVYRNVLLFSSDSTKNSLNWSEPESAVLLGDAAAAAVVTSTNGQNASAFLGAQFATFSSGAMLTHFLGAGTLHHPNDPATVPSMNLFHMDGPGVFRLATRSLGPFIDRFLAIVGWEPEQVDAVIPHQASRHGIEYLLKHARFQIAQLIVNLADRGNCIAASLPLALAEAAHGGRIRRGQRLLMIGTGAGITLGAAAIIF